MTSPVVGNACVVVVGTASVIDDASIAIRTGSPHHGATWYAGSFRKHLESLESIEEIIELVIFMAISNGATLRLCYALALTGPKAVFVGRTYLRSDGFK